MPYMGILCVFQPHSMGWKGKRKHASGQDLYNIYTLFIKQHTCKYTTFTLLYNTIILSRSGGPSTFRNVTYIAITHMTSTSLQKSIAIEKWRSQDHICCNLQCTQPSDHQFLPAIDFNYFSCEVYTKLVPMEPTFT